MTTVILLLFALSAPGSWAAVSDGVAKLVQDLESQDPEAAAEVAEAAEIMHKAEQEYEPEPLSNEDSDFLEDALEELGEREYRSDEDDSIEHINEESGISSALYESDIILTKEQSQMLFERNESTREKRSAPMIGNVELWDKTQPIPYTLDGSLSPDARTAIRAGLKAWERGTCLRFQENGRGPNSLRFFRGNGCYANLGRITRKPQQEVSIGRGCESVGTTAHETAHALGMHHTHVRHDRDNYVVVNQRNVRGDAFSSNFKIETRATNENYGLPYELGSIMHYSGFAFAVNQKVPTIVSRDVNYENTMGNRRPPTVNDILMMNTHYKCTDQCRGRGSPRCQNGGVQDVNSCGTCICPTGFTGSDCSKRPSQCGAELEATSQWQTLDDMIGRQGKPASMDFEECVWWIRGRRGRQVEVLIEGMWGVYGSGCGAGGIEIKAQSDMRLTGYVFCNAKGKSIRSSNEVVPIIAFNRQAFNQFVLKYRLA